MCDIYHQTYFNAVLFLSQMYFLTDHYYLNQGELTEMLKNSQNLLKFLQGV